MIKIAQEQPSAGIYSGERTIDGLVVMYKGAPLTKLLALDETSNDDFEWGYEGDSPARLAHALLLHRTGDPAVADAFSIRLMVQFVAKLDNEWEVREGQLDRLIEEIQQSTPALSFLTIQRRNIFKRLQVELLAGVEICFLVRCGA